MDIQPAKDVLNDNASGYSTDSVEVTFYTDPLCCWSWAMKPAWEQLRSEYKDILKVRYKMGGLIPSWDHFNDHTNSVARPAQMGPEWMHAAKLSGTDINSGIWVIDPPASSYPACIAVKCVENQSPGMVETFLYLLWEGVMSGRRNIARTAVLFEAATALHALYPAFDLSAFGDHLLGEKGKNLFKSDLQEAKYLNITRLPTLIIRRRDGSIVMIQGYQTYESLCKAIL